MEDRVKLRETETIIINRHVRTARAVVQHQYVTIHVAMHKTPTDSSVTLPLPL